jgi:hypothetical protein
MFLRANFSIANLASMTLISVTVGTISLLPMVGFAQTFVPPPQPSSCAQLVQRLNLSTAQQEQAATICNRGHGWMTTESIAALRVILDATQLETLEQYVREGLRLIDSPPSSNSCGGKQKQQFPLWEKCSIR